VHVGNPNAVFTAVVVGCIHGDEPAGIPIARALESRRPDPSVSLWVIEDLNPDGVIAHTRQNADGVDLNRNFPYNWQQIGRRGDEQYSGPGALSEPEARAAAAFLDRVRPSVTIWFHQHADVVDYSGGNPAIERWFARAVGLPVAELTRYPGSVAGWENHRFPGSTAFVVELPAGPATPAFVERATAAIDRIDVASRTRKPL
jgi:murein peptide amidase A